MWIICDRRLNCVTVILAQMEAFIHEFWGKLSRCLYTSVKETFVQWFLVSGVKQLWFIVMDPYYLVFLFIFVPRFFLCNVGDVCATFAGHLQQPVITKILNGPKQKSPKSGVVRYPVSMLYLCNSFFWRKWKPSFMNSEGSYLDVYILRLKKRLCIGFLSQV